MGELNESEMNEMRPLLEKAAEIVAKLYAESNDSLAAIVDEVNEKGFELLLEINLGVTKQENISFSPPAAEPKRSPPKSRRRKRQWVKKDGELDPLAFNKSDNTFLTKLRIKPIETSTDLGGKSGQ
jgi:hypothetical protein